MNQVILVGKIVENPILKETENKSVTTIKLAVTRPFKNANGIYENDILSCVLWNGIASNTCEYCHAGDVVAVKGRLQQTEDDKGPNIIAEKVSFLSSRKDEKSEHISNN